jgi:hypothetical protein
MNLFRVYFIFAASVALLASEALAELKGFTYNKVQERALKDKDAKSAKNAKVDKIP